MILLALGCVEPAPFVAHTQTFGEREESQGGRWRTREAEGVWAHAQAIKLLE